MYVKLSNGALQYAPTNYKTSEGSLILNFNKNITLMKEYGFKELIDIRPYYDNSTQYLTIDGYQENEDTITINYKINEIETNNEPTLEERVQNIEELIAKVQVELLNLKE